MITREQCKMARAALGWSVRELGARADVTPNTVSNYEVGKNVNLSTVEKLKEALEKGGVMFLYPDALGGPGVRLRV